MEKRIEIMPQMKGLLQGEEIRFPIDKLCTIRNNVSLLNAQGYVKGYKWQSRMNKEAGTVTVTRLA